MAQDTKIVETLFEKATDYTNTSIELLKLKAVDKTSDGVSSIVPSIIIVLIFSFMFLFLNLSIGFWIGDVLGKTYLGFLILAGFYTLLCLVLYFFLRNWMKKTIYDAMIRFLLK